MKSVLKSLQTAFSSVSSYVNLSMASPSENDASIQGEVDANGSQYSASGDLSERMSSSGRLNPFDLDSETLAIDENHFDQAVPTKQSSPLRRERTSASASQIQNFSDSVRSLSMKNNDSTRLLTDLSVTEDHFSRPETALLGLSAGDELEAAITECKQRIETLNCQIRKVELDETVCDEQSKRRWAEERAKQVQLLVALRLRLHERVTLGESKSRNILGHRFVEPNANQTPTGADETLLSLESSQLNAVLAEDVRSRARQRCDYCAKPIWTLLQDSLVCSLCSFRTHQRCMNLVTRHCVALRLEVKGENKEPWECYELNICPERGLLQQQFRCAECHINFVDKCEEPVKVMVSSDFVGSERRLRDGRSFLTSLSVTYRDEDSLSTSPQAILPAVIDESQFAVRQCDYCGLYFCPACHWNDVAVIPARVIHNWDFQPRPVCRASKQILTLLQHRAVFDLDLLNRSLFELVPALGRIRRFREAILMMKRYFLHCRNALDSGILLMLSNRQHFVETASIFSFRDLLDLHDGVLERELSDVTDRFERHIRYECPLCQAKAFICEICNNDADALFLFDDVEMKVSICEFCSTVYHKGCFEESARHCRKCERLHRRRKTSES